MSLSDRYLFAIKSEDISGDDAFGGSDPTEFLACFGQPSLLEEYTPVEAEVVRANASRDAGLRYEGHTAVSFEAPMLPKEATAGDPPPLIADILKMCGFEETITAGTSAAYTPRTGNIHSATPSASAFFGIRDDVDGNYFTRLTKGIKGAATISAAEGQEARISVEAMGLFSKMASTSSSISDPTSYNAGLDRFSAQGLTLAHEGTEYDVGAVELSLNQSAQTEIVSNAVKEIYLASSHDPPSMSVGFKGRSAVVADILSQTHANADGSIPLGAVTLTLTMGAHTIEVSIPHAKIPMYSETTTNSRYQFDMDLIATSPLSNPGDDEIELTWT